MNKYDKMVGMTEKQEYEGIGSYIQSLGHNERIDFLDKLITSDITVTGVKYYQSSAPKTIEIIDENISKNLDLYFLAVKTKLLSPFWKEYDRLSQEITKGVYIVLHHTMAEFAIKKINMLYATATSRGVRMTYTRGRCVKTQQKLLGYIAKAWAEESDMDKTKRYMDALIGSVITAYGDIPSIAIREAGKYCVITKEKIVQAIEMCCDAFKHKESGLINNQLHPFVQTLAISWIKSLKSPDEILERIKGEISTPDKK